MGFGVGTEPLPALFASMGYEIVASDLATKDSEAKGWCQGNQLCYGKDSLNEREICEEKLFERNVSYQVVDMNNIPQDLCEFDFNWSSCALEHLGSLQHGLVFLENQISTLKIGGWGVHTTEFNVSSDSETFERDDLVLYRMRDILTVVDKIRGQGHFVEEIDFSLGRLPQDYFVDVPPYSAEPHLWLQIADYVITSIGLIIQCRV